MSSLAPLRIMVTRPRPSGETLCEHIRKKGGEAIFFPAIDIEPETQPVPSWEGIDWLIFISPQAVHHAIHRLLSRPSSIKVAAVGLSTAEALQAKGWTVDLYPTTEWSSEGLLNSPAFQTVAGKHMLIVKGEGGREQLREQLTQRGARVSEWIVYRRCLPQLEVRPYLQKLRRSEIDIIICTSEEGIRNLIYLLHDETALLLKIPLLVVSERLRACALKQGFQRILVAKQARHESIIKTLYEEKGLMMTPESKEHRSMRWVNIGILFSSVGVVSLLSVFYIAFHQLNDVTQNLSATVEGMQKTLTATQTQANEATEQLRQLTENVNKQAQNVTPDWRMAEAYYLTKLAQDQLQFMHNVPLALTLLQSASREIESLTDPRIQNVQKILTQDIARLKNIPIFNIEAPYLQLVAVEDKIDQLPLPLIPPSPSIADAKKEELSHLPWWRRGLHQTWQSLQKIVTVQHVEDHQKPLVTAEQREALYLNLHAKLEAAKWGLLHQQSAIYESSLKQVTQWVKRYFLPERLTLSVLSTLGDLQKINITPVTVSVADSLKALQGWNEG